MLFSDVGHIRTDEFTANGEASDALALECLFRFTPLNLKAFTARHLAGSCCCPSWINQVFNQWAGSSQPLSLMNGDVALHTLSVGSMQTALSEWKWCVPSEEKQKEEQNQMMKTLPKHNPTGLKPSPLYAVDDPQTSLPVFHWDKWHVEDTVRLIRTVQVSDHVTSACLHVSPCVFECGSLWKLTLKTVVWPTKVCSKEFLFRSNHIFSFYLALFFTTALRPHLCCALVQTSAKLFPLDFSFWMFVYLNPELSQISSFLPQSGRNTVKLPR